ncbi:MAG: hypothetical protein ACYC3X_02605 [Pirellulaceae bacterium]
MWFVTGPQFLTGSGEEAQRMGQLREMPVVLMVCVEVFHEWLAMA